VTRTALILAALLLPAACNHTPSFAELSASCASMGYAESSAGHAACMDYTAQRAAVAAERRAMGFAMMGAWGQRLANPPRTYVQPPMRMQTSCRPNPYTGGFVCN
jgi:hypothetical protein